jgi:hypothetical protein
MRFFVLLLVLVSLASADLPNLTLTTGKTCPGSILWMNATGPDGQPAAGVTLRVVLYDPYQGLVALRNTTEDGSASVGLTMNGTYRVYINSQDYAHDEYVELPFTLCPPPPPKSVEVGFYPDCNSSSVLISLTSDGAPLVGAFVSTQNWSSLTGSTGNVSFPFSGGDVLIRVKKAGYAEIFVFETVDCNPPECRTHDDCADDEYCVAGTCMNVTGICGYPQNHGWVHYACCSDSDCENGSLRCVNRTCVAYQPPPVPANITKNASAAPASPSSAGSCAGAAAILLLAAFSIRK